MKTLIATIALLFAATASASDWFNPVDDVTYRHPPQIPRQRVCHRQPVMRFVGYQRRFVWYQGGFWRLEWCEVWERSDVTVCR